MGKRLLFVIGYSLFSVVLSFSVALLVSCGPKLPTDYDEADSLPKIYPDYTDVTIPVNIAPLTFVLDEEADEMIARYSVGSAEIVCTEKMQPDIDDWRSLVQAAMTADGGQAKAGGDIQADVYARHGDRWLHYRPFQIHVSPDSIDPWMSYRLIPPSFISYEALTISQRCLEDYDERVVYDNMLCGLEKDGQCINCHSYQQYNPERMQFHARQSHGGTVIAYDGILRKINMKHDSILSAGVYPAWHPWLRYIVYSSDNTVQSFHTTDKNKIEVYDTASDLIAYDIDRGEVMNIENDPDEMEVVPAWAPDGRTLYYCSAHFVRNDSIKNVSVDVASRVDTLRYCLYRKSFDPETKQFGPRELVSLLSPLPSPAEDSQPSPLTSHLSIALPRVSPDGRYLLFSAADHGYFHIWHHDADLWIVDLSRCEVRGTRYEDSLSAEGNLVPRTSNLVPRNVPRTSHLVPRRIDEVNSDDTESYHSWSSNSRWIVFSSRRNDGVFTRPFFAHIDDNGHFGKPFERPSADPLYHRQMMRSYNIPEFMRGPVTIDPHTFASILKSDGEPVKYGGTR